MAHHKHLPMPEVIYAYTELGQSLTTIANRYGVSPSTVRTRLQESGIATGSGPTRSGALPVSVKVTAYLLSEGYNLGDVARLFGVSAEQVAEVIVATALETSPQQTATDAAPQPERAPACEPPPPQQETPDDAEPPDNTPAPAQAPDIPADYLRPADVNLFYGVHARTLAHWSQAGYIDTVRTPEGDPRYRRADIESRIENPFAPPPAREDATEAAAPPALPLAQAPAFHPAASDPPLPPIGQPEPSPRAESTPADDTLHTGCTTGEYLYIAQAVQEYGIDYATVRRWADNGNVCTQRPKAGPRRYHRGDIARMATAPPADTETRGRADHDRSPELAAPAAIAQPPAQADQAPDLLTSREVAERLRVDPKTVVRWVDEGRITAVRTLGGRGHHRIPRAEVERLLHGPDPAQADTTSPQEDATG